MKCSTDKSQPVTHARYEKVYHDGGDDDEIQHSCHEHQPCNRQDSCRSCCVESQTEHKCTNTADICAVYCINDLDCKTSQGGQGPQGDEGAQGPPGSEGDQGPPGDEGAQGPQGDEGPQGPQGDEGAQGPQGDEGPQGADGNIAAECFGYIYDSTLADESDPGMGMVRMNGAFGSPVEIIIDINEEDAMSPPGMIGDFLQSIKMSMNSIPGHVRFVKKSDPSVSMFWAITELERFETISPPSAWWSLTVTELSGLGGFVDDDEIDVCFSVTGTKGDIGPQGPQGDIGTDISQCSLRYVDGVAGVQGDVVEICDPITNPPQTVAEIKKVVCDKTPEWLWARGVVSNSGFAEVNSIATTSDGHSYVTGRFEGTVTFQNSPLVELIADDEHNVFIAKIDTQGTWLWAIQISATDDSGGKLLTELDLDCDGNVYVIGTFKNTVTFPTNPPSSITSPFGEDVFISKIDPNENWLWNAFIASNTNDVGASGIKTDCDGNSYVVGSFDEASVISNGTVTFIGTDLNTNTLSGSGSTDAYVAKIDTNGIWIWSNRAGAPTGTVSGTAVVGADVSVDCRGNVYVVGSYQSAGVEFPPALTLNDTIIINGVEETGGFQMFVAKLDKDGKWSWANKAGRGILNFLTSISSDRNGNSYITGILTGTSASAFGIHQILSIDVLDIFVAKIDTNGNWLWARNVGGMSDDDVEAGIDVQTDFEGNAYVTGIFQDVATFGSITITASADGDNFIAKIDPSGNWLWVLHSSDAVGGSIGIDCYGSIYSAGAFQRDITFFFNDPPAPTLSLVGDDTENSGFVAKIKSTDINTLGMLNESANTNDIVSVFFPGSAVSKDIFGGNLMPGYNYYINNKCELTKCCCCPIRCVGLACDQNHLITGLPNKCCCLR
jgi:Collagen triple helix repeat (20 copies)